MNGFIARTSLNLIQGSESLLPLCGKCQLYRSCNSPKMPPSGRGKRRVLIVGEFPSRSDDEEGEHLRDKAGNVLEDALEKMGVDLRKDCWITNALICRPKGSRLPSSKEIDYCRANLEKTIREREPQVIILMGKMAVESFLKNRFADAMSKGGVQRWLGWVIPCRSPNAWVVPTWHPYFLLRKDNEKMRDVLQREWERHLKAAFNLQGRPWEAIPNEKERCRCIYDPQEAAGEIEKIIKAGKVAAWDLETTCLKPDGAETRIVTCSISNGDRTFAYPWQGEAIEATKRFILSDVPKVGAGIKFESRWTKAKLGIWPKNWVWDVQLAAHAIDNRQGATGLDFISFVLSGVPNYWRHLEPFMRSKGRGGNNQNKVGKREVDLGDLLLYNSLDSLVEWECAQIQMRQMGVSNGNLEGRS